MSATMAPENMASAKSATPAARAEQAPLDMGVYHPAFKFTDNPPAAERRFSTRSVACRRRPAKSSPYRAMGWRAARRKQ
jgi:hypothetical protein